jgi:hypothetical protein
VDFSCSCREDEALLSDTFLHTSSSISSQGSFTILPPNTHHNVQPLTIYSPQWPVCVDKGDCRVFGVLNKQFRPGLVTAMLYFITTKAHTFISAGFTEELIATDITHHDGLAMYTEKQSVVMDLSACCPLGRGAPGR